jgi:hypothetical protein
MRVMVTRTRARQLGCGWLQVAVCAVMLSVPALSAVGVQRTLDPQTFDPNAMYKTGQNIAPAFDGWIVNPDGTFDMVFGYMNRNWEEQPDVPIGPNNNIEPGGPDRGQPTHFFPRRNRHVFRVRVPKDFGEKELVWTLVVNGIVERAYATLKPDYVLEPVVMTHNEGGGTPREAGENTPPVVRLEGDAQRTAKVGEPLSLNAFVSDDGLLKPRPAPRLSPGLQPGWSTAAGLRVAWFVYRGAGTVTFDPEQFKVYADIKGNSPFAPGWTPPLVPADGKYSVKVTFGAPGTFVIRVMAHDGGLKGYQDVTVNVTPR